MIADRLAFMDSSRRKIGERIRLIRTEQGIPLGTFALMVGIERSYLGKIEAGKINTSLDKLEKIVRGLGYADLFEFFDGSNFE